MVDESTPTPNPKSQPINTVRKLFLTAAVIMIISYPIFSPNLPEGPIFITIAIVLLGVLAGLTNAKQRWTLGSDMVVSLWGVLFFESHAIMFAHTFTSIFIVDEVLVLIFLSAAYFSIRAFWQMLSE